MKYNLGQFKRRLKLRLVLIISSAIALVLLGALGARQAYYLNLQPVSTRSQLVQLFTVKSGDSPEVIAKGLKAAGLIRSVWAFKLYASLKNVDQSLEAGTYEFSPRLGTAEIVSQLTNGKVASDLVTILPGQSLPQIRQALVKYGFNVKDVDAALEPSRYQGHPALVGKPDGAGLEGYIYPDSYQKIASTKPDRIIEQALDEMNEHLPPGLRRALESQGLSVYQAIALASVVEQEVSKPDDRAKAAQVFLKRLRLGMALESDATSPDFDSYNQAGLPPTPISNVAVSSLTAVAYPASTDWLYFVSGDNGTTYFSHTLAEHEANVARYCHKLCQ